MIRKNSYLRAEVCRALGLSFSKGRPASVLAKSALAACATFGSLGAFAQETTTPEKTLPTVKIEDEGETQPAVTQVGKTPQLLRDVPQTISVIDRATIEAQGATTLTEALRNVPGITLSAGEGGNIGDNINLRGFSARTDLYLDGLRDRGQYSRETAFLESVEVLKGPSSMLFGRGSTGGVINQVTKQPTRREFAQVGGSVGTDAYYRVTADLNQPFAESSAFRVAAFGHTNESTRDIVESERYGIAPSLRLGFGATELIFSAMLQRRDDLPDYGFPVAAGTVENPGKPIDADRDNFYGYTDDYFRQDVDVVGIRVSHEFSPAFTLRNQTQLNSARIEARPTTINAAGVRNPRRREIDDTALFNQTDMVVKLGEGFLRHTLTIGAEIGRDDYENQTYNTTPGAAPFTQNLVNPVYGPVPADAVVALNAFTDNVGDTLAAYANEQLDVGDHWKFVLGLRWDRFEFDSTTTNNANGAVTVTPTKTDETTSPRAGVIFQPDSVQTYYVSYGTSFNPSAETLTINAANQNIDPEENRSYEVGAKWSFSEGALLITTAAFRVDKDNARTTDPVLGVTLDGEIRVQGVELGVSGNVTEAWYLLAGYTYLDGEILNLTESGVSRNGNTVPNTPEHNATFWTTYDLPFGLQIGGGLIYASDRLLNNANTAIVDGYARVDATVAYLATRYSMRLNLQNVTNEEYFEVASAGRATPAQSFGALATFNWMF